MSRIARPSIAALIALALALSPVAFSSFSAVASPSAVAADGDVTWSVEPTPTPDGLRRAFEYSVDPGTQIVDSVLITNQGQTTADFVIYATDAINEVETGAFGLLKRDEAPIDSGAWIELASDKITLEPGTQATVPFNLLVPSDALPGDHVAGIVASVITKGTQDGAAVTLEQRVGARVYLTVSGVREASVEVSGVTSGFSASWNPFAPGEVTARYDVRNTGNTRIDVNQAVVVTGPFGIPLGEYEPDPLKELLPRQTVRVSATLPSIVALLLAWSTVTVLPGEVGTAGAIDPLAANVTPSETPEAVASDTATETATATPDDAATPAPDDSGVTDAVVSDTVVTDADTVEFEPVSSTVATPAISWTLAAIILLVIVIIYLIARYVSGTRERMYLAIDEAAAAAREQALAESTRGIEK